MDGRVDLKATRLPYLVAVMAGMLSLLVLLGGCGDEPSTGASAPDGAATDEPVESLEGHATENPGGASEPDTANVDLAPELERAGAWYNSEPLSMAGLRGKPVLLVFWATY
jgi:hypothetical protein